MKAFLLAAIFMCSLVTPMLCQNEQINHEKYWKYRDRMRKDFMKIGTGDGMSIPMSSRCIGLAYSEAPEVGPESLPPSRIYFQDATIYSSHYLAALVTEIKLLSDEIQITSNDPVRIEHLEQALAASNSECYYVLKMLDRIDENADRYLSQDDMMPLTINGRMLRDDVPADFHLNFLDDFSVALDRPAYITHTHSDREPLQIWTDNPAIPAGTQIAYNRGNNLTLDQISYLLMGLTLAFDLLEDEEFTPPTGEVPMNLKAKSREIAIWTIHSPALTASLC